LVSARGGIFYDGQKEPYGCLRRHTMKIWIDLVNTSHPIFFKSLMKEFHQGHQTYITARDRSETVALARELGMVPKVIGTDFSNRIVKAVNHVLRTIELFIRVPKFDVALAFGGSTSIAVAKARTKPSVVFNDNDLIFTQATLAGRLETRVIARADHIIIPSAFPAQVLTKRGAKVESIYQFNGYKEDVYIADYESDPDFPAKLPFSNFVVLRPEALFAAYVTQTRSIVPELVSALVANNINVVYLPRIEADWRHVELLRNDRHIFVPKQALNGLDLCWYSQAVLTGSGTFAREAACLGTTAVSFFPERLLAVDQQLVSEGKMLHSRNIDEITEYVVSSSKMAKNPSLERCKEVKRQVVSIVNLILENLEG
jgi:predicted glycosyltransferase